MKKEKCPFNKRENPPCDICKKEKENWLEELKNLKSSGWYLEGTEIPVEIVDFIEKLLQQEKEKLLERIKELEEENEILKDEIYNLNERIELLEDEK
jgi:gas vesicle protein